MPKLSNWMHFLGPIVWGQRRGSSKSSMYVYGYWILVDFFSWIYVCLYPRSAAACLLSVLTVHPRTSQFCSQPSASMYGTSAFKKKNAHLQLMLHVIKLVLLTLSCPIFRKPDWRDHFSHTNNKFCPLFHRLAVSSLELKPSDPLCAWTQCLTLLWMASTLR